MSYVYCCFGLKINLTFLFTRVKYDDGFHHSYVATDDKLQLRMKVLV